MIGSPQMHSCQTVTIRPDLTDDALRLLLLHCAIAGLSFLKIMNRKILGTTLVSALICSCAARPPVAFDGDSALPAPPNGQVASMNAALLEQQSHEQERSTLMQKILELGNELSELKNRMQQKPASAPDPAVASAANAAVPVSAAAATVPKSAAPGSGASSARSKSRSQASSLTMASRVNRETIVIQDTGMIFRVMHGFAKTDFHPSKSLQLQLLQAARAGKRIDIRGRTDAANANQVDLEIAMQRALNARLFLANNGIHPRKMHIDYKAAGDHVADNTTAEGRARNRRVEIETAGMAPEALEDLAAVIRQDLQ